MYSTVIGGIIGAFALGSGTVSADKGEACTTEEGCEADEVGDLFLPDSVGETWPVVDLLHPARPINGELYGAQVAVARWLWQGHQLFLGMVILLDQLQDQLLVLGERLLIGSVPLYTTLLIVCTGLAIQVGALERFGAGLWGKRGSHPLVHEGRLLVLVLVGVAYLGSPMLYLQFMEDLRRLIENAGGQIGRTLITHDLFHTEDLMGDRPWLNRSLVDVDDDGGLALVWQHLGVSSVAELYKSELPNGLIGGHDRCCFGYMGNRLGFELLTMGEQARQKEMAGWGIQRLLSGYLFVLYVLLWRVTQFVLTGGMVWLFVQVPFGLIGGLFSGYEIILGRYVQGYVGLVKESFLTAVLFGLVHSIVMNGAESLPFTGLAGVVSLGSCMALWRCGSAVGVVRQASWHVHKGGLQRHRVGNLSMMRVEGYRETAFSEIVNGRENEYLVYLKMGVGDGTAETNQSYDAFLDGGVNGDINGRENQFGDNNDDSKG